MEETSSATDGELDMATDGFSPFQPEICKCKYFVAAGTVTLIEPPAFPVPAFCPEQLVELITIVDDVAPETVQPLD